MKTFLYYHPQGIEEGELSLFGIDHRDSQFLQTSFHDLKREMDVQKRMLALDIHPDNQLCPWGDQNEILVVEEGEFTWNPSLLHYEKVS